MVPQIGGAGQCCRTPFPHDKTPQLAFQSTGATVMHLAANLFKERKKRLVLKVTWEYVDTRFDLEKGLTTK